MALTTKDNLVRALIEMVANKGVQNTRIREISRKAGITEGAMYRHFTSKEDLYWYAYKGIVEEMYQQKKPLLRSSAPIEERLGEWIRCTYLYYDRSPDAFTFVLLTPHILPQSEYWITTQQGDLFMQMIQQAIDRGQVRGISAGIALSHFTGIMLNIPRLINEGRLEGPAARYVNEAANAIWQVLKPKE